VWHRATLWSFSRGEIEKRTRSRYVVDETLVSDIAPSVLPAVHVCCDRGCFVRQLRTTTLGRIAAIRKAGGEVQMGIGKPGRLEKWFGAELFGTVNKVDLREGKADNTLLSHIAALKELRRLDLSNADIDDDGLRRVVDLPLRELWLQEAKITDASADTLSRIKTLDFLQLNATSVSDGFLERLEPLPELEDLGLRGTHVSGVGMQYLSRHPKLKKLDVYMTDVDDSGVGQLNACQSLVRLGLSMTKVRASGATR
jgi:hypothetical protein